MSNSPTSPTCGWVLLPDFKASPELKHSTPTMALRTQTLAKSWEWKQRGNEKLEWKELESHEGWTTTSVPTEIFKDLLAAGKIADPHVDQNEKEVQWVGETDWLYRTQFTLEYPPAKHEKAVLAFDGLDTFAFVYLNGTQILKTEVCYHRSLLMIEHVS
jgi:beta-mannosidase